MNQPTDEYRILVSGWRNWPAHAAASVHSQIQAEVTSLRATWSLLVIHGACPTGVDSCADQWATEWANKGAPITVERHPANWHLYGKGAGPRRNVAMVTRDPAPHIMLAFPGPTSPGTWHCIRTAKRYGVPVKVFPYKEWA